MKTALAFATLTALSAMPALALEAHPSPRQLYTCAGNGLSRVAAHAEAVHVPACPRLLATTGLARFRHPNRT